MVYSKILRTSCEFFLGATSLAGARFQTPSENSVARYTNFLITIHQFVRAAVPLMEAAVNASRVAKLPISNMLEAYLQRHIPEEELHEYWVLEDLETIGIPRESVLRVEPPPEVASLVGAHYYWIRHFNPLSVLGYITFQEGFHISNRAVDSMREATALPEAAFRTVRFHALSDTDHSEDLFTLIDTLGLSQSDFAFIRRTAIYTLLMYAAVLRKIPEETLI